MLRRQRFLTASLGTHHLDVAGLLSNVHLFTFAFKKSSNYNSYLSPESIENIEALFHYELAEDRTAGGFSEEHWKSQVVIQITFDSERSRDNVYFKKLIEHLKEVGFEDAKEL